MYADKEYVDNVYFDIEAATEADIEADKDAGEVAEGDKLFKTFKDVSRQDNSIKDIEFSKTFQQFHNIFKNFQCFAHISQTLQDY